MLSQAKYPNCDFVLNDKQVTKRSFQEYVKKILNTEQDFYNILYNKNKNYGIDIYINYEHRNTPNILGDVNLRHCDGTYISNFTTLLKNIISEKLGKKYSTINPNNFLNGLNCYISLTVPEPKFDSQSKVRMTLGIRDLLSHPRLLKNLNTFLSDTVLDIIKSNLDTKLEKKLITSVSKKKISVENKLKDCLNIPGKVLYIVEGDSALSPLKQIRDINTEGIYPVRGKMLNVEKASVEKIAKNKEITDLLEALGPSSARRYEKIKIIADADPDGGHIVTLAVLIILKYADDYIKNNNLIIVLPPLYGATKGTKFIPIYNHDDIKKYPNYEITRFKGLGQMDPDKLKIALDEQIEYVVEYPETSDQANTLLNIMSNTEYKRKLLLKPELTVQTLLNRVLKEKLKTKKGVSL
jgi:DNA gyrase/topoisomerase IV subunit B